MKDFYIFIEVPMIAEATRKILGKRVVDYNIDIAKQTSAKEIFVLVEAEEHIKHFEKNKGITVKTICQKDEIAQGLDAVAVALDGGSVPINDEASPEDVFLTPGQIEKAAEKAAQTTAKVFEASLILELSFEEITFAVQHMINIKHEENGVSFWDKNTAYISPDVTIGEGTEILPNVVMQGDVTIGKNCTIGPFVHLRPGTVLGDDVVIGNFMELKGTHMGSGSKAKHLSYLGDATIGENVNIGCGTITVNHDGARKHKTTIGNDAYIGCNSNLIAPVAVGEGAFVAAGSTINKDVPPKNLGIARARQENKEGWKSPKQKKNEE